MVSFSVYGNSWDNVRMRLDRPAAIVCAFPGALKATPGDNKKVTPGSFPPRVVTRDKFLWFLPIKRSYFLIGFSVTSQTR